MNEKRTAVDIGYLIDKIGMFLLLLCGLGYFLNPRRFAEWHVQFSFLDFPVFVGEITLFLCLILLGLKRYLCPTPWKKWHAAVLFYVLFVVGKAWIGYSTWGPLALRDSAMMYYPLFALFAYSFFRQEFFRDAKVILIGIGTALIALKFFWSYEYFLLMAVILTFLLIKAYPEKRVRWILWGLLLLAIPYQKFFTGSRTMLLGLIASMLFCFIALFYVIPLRARYKGLILAVAAGLIVWGVKTSFDPYKLEAMFNIDAFVRTMRIQQEELDFRKKNFVPVRKDVEDLRLYNPEGVNDPGDYAMSHSEYYVAESVDWSPELDSAIGNVSFRLHIWRDMIDQMMEAKPIAGFDFGMPLRSPRIEMLSFAVEVWNRDGWIGAHNSFLYLIYRAGIIGVVLFVMLLMGFVYLIRRSLKNRSVAGILLCGIIIFWLVAANFLMIFELPYNAIPLWALIGAVFAYLIKPQAQERLVLDATTASQLTYLIDKIGLYILAVCALGYMLNARRFAEIFVQLPYLDFPIFIGEVAIFLCLFLLTVKWLIEPPVWRRWFILPVLYAVFVVVKALTGYIAWGPLALRDSALMYYPVCILFGHTFYRAEFFGRWTVLLGIGVIMFALRLSVFYEYFLLMAVVVAFLLIRAYPEKNVRWLLGLLLLLVIPYQEFFKGSRTMILGLFFSGVFCLAAFSFTWPVKRRYKLLTLLLFAVFMIYGVAKYGDVYKVRTLLNITYYKNMLSVLAERKKYYVPQEIKTLRLYNPESSGKADIAEQKEEREQAEDSEEEVVMIAAQDVNAFASETAGSFVASAPKPPVSFANIDLGPEVQEPQKESDTSSAVYGTLSSKAQQLKREHDISSVYGNITFRVLIWRDMIDQMLEFRPWLGFDFGKPLRSPSIEMLHIALDEWQRDGWIGAHNSFLHIIYRAGLVGILFIVSLLLGFSYLVTESLKRRSAVGILCCAVLIFWFFSANFLLILELPYNAIPIWTLFGLTLAYLSGGKEKAA